MIFGTMLMLTAIVLAGPDIHRCKTEDGGIHYQETPCLEGDESVLRAEPGDRNVDPKRLQQWLDEMPQDKAYPTRGSQRNRTRRPHEPLPSVRLVPRPHSTRLQASCSMLFYRCAGGDDRYTDRCVSTLNTCSNEQRSGCCHAAFVHRYSTLRAAGAPRQSAIAAALLGTDGERRGE